MSLTCFCSSYSYIALFLQRADQRKRKLIRQLDAALQKTADDLITLIDLNIDCCNSREEVEQLTLTVNTVKPIDDNMLKFPYFQLKDVEMSADQLEKAEGEGLLKVGTLL